MQWYRDHRATQEQIQPLFFYSVYLDFWKLLSPWHLLWKLSRLRSESTKHEEFYDWRLGRLWKKGVGVMDEERW
ncbi:60S ribosomal protein L38 [Fusarium oxysporum f. sp. albedinis]|jgi:hypothetical protein|nr:60S ribosomal protein L38 [Fusarium oxysporum f. sp. albedinis]